MPEKPVVGLFDPIEVVGEDTLKTITNFCVYQLNLQKEVEKLTEELKNKKKELEDVSREQIPKLLNKTGLSELRLANGYKIVVEDKLYASVPEKNYILAYQNMIEAEGGGDLAEEKIDNLFKTQVIISEMTDDVLEVLLDNDIVYDSKRTVHPQTLKKYCKERLGQGKEIPEGISVFEYQETKITK
jgi:hypothetical protein